MARFAIQSTVDLDSMDTFGEGAVALENLGQLFSTLYNHYCVAVCNQLAHPAKCSKLQAAAVKVYEQNAAVAQQIRDNLTITHLACDPERKERRKSAI